MTDQALRSLTWGRPELDTTTIGLGASRLGAFWQRRSPAEGLQALRVALDGGVRLVDTADCYARGISERLVGRATADRPDVTVMTKVGLLKTPAAMRRAGHRRLLPHADESCFTADYVLKATDATQRRLGRDPDVLLLHDPDAATVTAPACLDVLQGGVRAGRWRGIGVSVRTPEAVAAALTAAWTDVIVLPLALVPGDAAGKTLVAMEVLDGGALQGMRDRGHPTALAVPALVRAAVAHPRVSSVLVGLSRPATASETLAGLEAPDGALDADARELQVRTP